MYIGNTPFQGLVGGGNILDASIEGVDLSTSAIAARLGYTPVDPGAAAITGGTIIGTTIGATNAAAGSFTTLAASGAVTLSGGTANGVPYLNGSKVVTTGSVLTFDGSTLGLSTANTGGTNTVSINNTAANGYSALTVKNTGASGKTYEAGVGGNGTAGNYQNNFYIRDITGNPSFYVNSAGAGVVGTLSAGNTTLTGTSALTVNRSGAAAQVALQNNGTTTGILVAGTTNGLVFYDAGAGLQMGTWASAAGLAVEGNLSVGPSSGAGGIAVGSAAGRAQYQYVNFGGSVGGTDYAWQIGRSPSGGVGPADGFYIYDIKASATRLSIAGSGNVGIGTDNPSYRLHVNGTAYINGTFLHSSLAYYPQQSISLSVGTSTWVKLFTINSPGGCRVRYNGGSQNSEEQGEFSIKGTYVASGTQLSWSRQTYYNSLNEIRVTGNNAGPYTVWALVRTTEFAHSLNWQVIEALNSVTIHNTTGETPGTAVATLSYTGYSSTNFNHDVAVTGKLYVKGTAGNADPFIRFDVVSPNSTFNWVSQAMASNLASGNNLVHFIGQDPSTKNSGYIGYKHSSSASDNNILTFGLYGVDNVLNINGAGKVGIGTTNPDEKLTVAGNIRIAGNQALIFQQASGPAVGAIRFTNGAGYQKAVIGSYYNIADEGAIEFVGPTSTTNMIFRSSGNLHIGATNDPGYRLGLTSDTTGDGILIDVLSNPTIVLRDRGNSDTKIGTGSTAGLDNFYISTYAVNHALMIKGVNGFVGIGTNDPGERLTVNGSIRSTTNAINFSGQTGAQFDYYNGEMRLATHNGTTTSIMYFNAGTGKLTVPGTVINSQGGGVGSTSNFYAAASIGPTTTSGGVAIYDIYLPDYFAVTEGMDLELYVHSNPNGGGSGSYRQTKHVTAHCMTTWYGSGYSPQLEWDSVNDYMGMGFDVVIYHVPTATEFPTQLSSAAGAGQSYFWNSAGIRLRVKVSGFNASYPGHQSLGLIVGYKS